ncbi:hypothetical protein AB0A60_20820 [Streptomyces sp. NPDC046275]|uniref:hypothetical protein n=1 Tax=Streptomyces sp. NPDC046275 TaxID=3157201 RepID=UPI0033D18871
MGWTREGFESHEGKVGVLLADGTEPGPVAFDMGSGAYFHESSDWWVYTGDARRPAAASMRGSCACGWRGERVVPIDWSRINPAYPQDYDVSVPEEDWEAHLDEVAARAVRLPEDLDELLRGLRGRLDELADVQPLAVLKAVGELESAAAVFGPLATRYLTGAEPDVIARLAEGLGLTEQAAGSRLRHYQYLTY